jgi:RNA polymerase sigma factor (sigma-70 family)
MLHHHDDFIDSVRMDQRRAAQRGRPPADAGELERFLATHAGRGARGQSAIDRLMSRMGSVARAHRLPAHQVDDVIQNTMLRLLEHRESIREPRAVGAWLQTTARNESLRVLRDGARARPVSPGDLPDRSELSPLQAHAESAERRIALLHAIDALPDRQRELMLALLAEPQPSYAEVARALDMPIGSIGPTRARALERLRRDDRLTSVTAAVCDL